MDSTKIEEQAAAWLVRRQSEEWSATDAAELAAWLEASTAHRVAFLRLEVGWEQTERLTALGAGRQPGAVPVRGDWRLSPLFEKTRPTVGPDTGNVSDGRVAPGASTGRSRFSTLATTRRVALAAAATILIAVGVGAYWSTVRGGEDYTTPIGGTASIPLRDGSSITLNTASRVRVALTDEQRHVDLDAGEAFFEVAKDPKRPFVVSAGDKRIVAVGTKFSVRRDGDDVRVVVTEGRVRIESADAHTDSQSSPAGGTVSLFSAGTIARASSAALQVQHKSSREVEEILSWRSGYLTFDETALADAVAEFNRYSSRKIYIDDPNVAAIRINGRFRAINADAFIRVLHDGFGIRAQETEDRIILTAN
jgi:transmembrane sensor